MQGAFSVSVGEELKTRVQRVQSQGRKIREGRIEKKIFFNLKE